MQPSQPPVPIRNYLYFIASVLALMIGWTWVKNRIWPPPPPQEIVWPLQNKPKGEHAVLFARLAQAATGRGLVDALDFAAQNLQPITPKVDAPQWPYELSPRKDQDAAIARMAGALADVAGPADVVRLAAACALNDRMIARHAETAQPAEEYTLGAPGGPITAVLTSQGAGVRELILNHFPSADKYGLPELDKDKKPKTYMVLIPRIDGVPPAFAVFHYAQAEEKEPRPLDTLGKIRWTVESKDLPREISFAAEVPEFGVRMIKTFTLEPASYHLGLSIRIERLPGAVASGPFRYQLAGARGLPIEGEWYATTFRNAMIGLTDAKGVLHRLTDVNRGIAHTGGSDRYRKDDKRLIYAALAVQYFTSAIVVDDRAADGSKLSAGQTSFLQFIRTTLEANPDPLKPDFADITVRAIPEAIDLAASAPVEHRYLLYHGPVKVQQLSRLAKEWAVAPDLVDRYSESLQLKSLTDYGTFGWWTDVIIIVTNLIHKLVNLLTTFLPSGIAIMVVTIIVRGMMFPISKKQAANMQRMQEKMKKVAPEMKEIDKKYREDFLMKQQAQRELYRKHNINPAAGLGGCLMLLLQMPIFMGLYYALQESVFFRLDSFLWIRNLAAPDMLVWWGETVPWLTRPDAQGMICYLGPYLNVLPLVGAALIFVQQKLSMPTEMTDEQRQQYAIMKYMTIFMALMFYRVPAGLSLYFICSSLWGLAERKLVKKMIEDESDERKGPAKGLPKKGPGKGGPNGKLAGEKKAPSRFRLWWEKLLRDASKK